MFLQPLIDELERQDIIRYVILTTSPKYKDIASSAPVLYVNESMWRFMKGNILLTGNSGVPRSLINGFKKRVHTFHSPVSILRIYPPDAFDAYNYFCASGEHHMREVPYLFESRNLPPPVCFKTGYMRIESIYKHSQKYTKKLKGNTIIIAPSWGQYNIINLFGYEIIDTLLKIAYNVILRPHPGNEYYNSNEIAKIKEAFLGNPLFFYDSWTGMDALCEADILIGDWSGISFEFACALNRPVIFIDTEPKNNSGMNVEMELFESYARKLVGDIVKIDDIDGIGDVVANVINNISKYEDRISVVKRELFYNCPISSTEVANSIRQLM